jgi:transcriptional regulator with XRE-family HTH domain
MSDEKIKAARIALGGFIKERREELAVTAEMLGELVGVSANTIKGVETGRFAMDVDLQFQIYQALGIKPYFSFDKEEVEEDYTLRKKDDPERYHGFYTTENLLLYPKQLAITKLTYPRLFLRFNYAESYFSSYEDWKNNIVTIQWLDPDDKPNSDDEIESHLIDCWNFLALHEEEEERLFNEFQEDDE